MAKADSVTQLLHRAEEGHAQSIEALLPLVYRELRALASSLMKGERNHTLQPTALVHEAFVKLVGAPSEAAPGDSTEAKRQWNGRDHFMAVAAIAMRQVLVDHSRHKTAVKRGGGAPRIMLHDDAAESASREWRVLELDDLLGSLAKVDERAARGAEMRLFGGMSQDQIARVQGISRTLVTTDWQFARAWLAARVGASEPSHG